MSLVSFTQFSTKLWALVNFVIYDCTMCENVCTQVLNLVTNFIKRVSGIPLRGGRNVYTGTSEVESN